MWEGGDVWILGGGPSVTHQFEIPDDLVKQVFEGTSSPNVYSPYMSFLHKKHVIGINVAYLIGDWIDMVFFGDHSWFVKHEVNLSKFKGLKVSCYPTHEKYPWVKNIDRDTSHPKGISNNPATVSWNCNSGSAAISVAANAGAKRIFLLGFDMKMNGNNTTHWHDLYGRGMVVEKSRLVKMQNTFNRHLTGFPEIAKDAKRRGIEIINVSPDSVIDVFPKVALKDLL
jgi:hypothetical protein